ncbi:MAG: hypothetical protein ACI8WT_003446 [Clostridium sp.]|jgi:hypothetical protein
MSIDTVHLLFNIRYKVRPTILLALLFFINARLEALIMHIYSLLTFKIIHDNIIVNHIYK